MIAGRLVRVVTARPAFVPLQRRRLVGRSVRPVAYGVVVATAAVTTVLGVMLAGRRTFTDFDLRYDVRIGRWFAGHERLALRLADLGSTVPVVLAIATIALMMLVLRRLRAVALAVLAPPLAILITDHVLKPLIDRAPFGVYTYPSGHTTAAFAVATVIVLLVLDETNAGARAVRWTVAVAVAALACFVALGLVAAGYHYFTDTIGGAGVGISVVVVAALVIDAIADRRAPAPPTPSVPEAQRVSA